MKKVIFLLSPLLLSISMMAQKVGIGTTTPDNTLHVFKGSAGNVSGFSSAPLIVENSANSYINILAPEVNATGIIFGKPSSNISGGIFYNDISFNPNGFDFRVNGNITQMVLNNTGNLGIGTLSPTARMHVVNGSSGAVGHGNAPLIVENSTNSFINILAPDAAATGIFLGGPTSGVSGGIIYNDASFNPNGLDFRVNGNITQMVLNNAGNLGIGTLSPGAKLHVFKGSAGSVTGNINSPLVVENSTHSYINILAPNASETGILFGRPANNVSGGIIYNSNGTGNGFQFRVNNNITQMVLSQAGNLGIGTADPGIYKLKVSHGNLPNGAGLDIENSVTLDDWELGVYGGNLYLLFEGVTRGSFDKNGGNYTYGSDERIKTNIRPMSTMLENIKQLKPSTYQFKNATNKQENIGFIAQDVMKIFPSMVVHNVVPERKIDLYTMDYSGFGVIAIKGIQELEPIIEKQKEKIATLEDRISKLETALAALTANNNGNISK